MEVATQDIAIITLLLIISAVGIATLSLRLPYPIALVLAGLALGAIIHSPLPLFHDLPLDTLEFTPHLILVVFLPALLFEATLHLEVTTLRKTLLPSGMLVGLLTGTLVPRLTARIDDHLIEITLTTILAYGTFMAAEALGVSGVIAVVTAGLVLSNVGARCGMSPTTRLALLTFWEYI